MRSCGLDFMGNVMKCWNSLFRGKETLTFTSVSFSRLIFKESFLVICCHCLAINWIFVGLAKLKPTKLYKTSVCTSEFEIIKVAGNVFQGMINERLVFQVRFLWLPSFWLWAPGCGSAALIMFVVSKQGAQVSFFSHWWQTERPVLAALWQSDPVQTPCSPGSVMKRSLLGKRRC